MNTADQKFSTISEYITARDAMPAGPDQSKEWATIARRFADPAQAEKFTIALRKFIAEIEARKAERGFRQNMSNCVCSEKRAQLTGEIAWSHLAKPPG